MSKRGHGQIRASQLITTYGPGALIDLPEDSAIVGGLECWSQERREILEPRLAAKVEAMTKVKRPQFFEPPVASTDPRETTRGITAWAFPEWVIVEAERPQQPRRIVHRRTLDDKGRFERRGVVPTRFVRACSKGHVADIDWFTFVHGLEHKCSRQLPLWLEETGTSGDLADLRVRCQCGASRGLGDAAYRELNPLGFCPGLRPWLGPDSREECSQQTRLLIRTATNAYFPQVVSVLSLPDRAGKVHEMVRSLWDDLQIVQDAGDLDLLRRKPKVATALAPFSSSEVLAAIAEIQKGSSTDRKVKEVELEAILAAPTGYGDDIPPQGDFHARKLPRQVWAKSSVSDQVAAVVQLHRLREVSTLVGFSRFEAILPDINGEYDTDVERAPLALEPSWFPAVENRGEGVFVQLQTAAVEAWLERARAKERLQKLAGGHDRWRKDRKSKRDFPGGPYLLLHTLSHALLQSLAMRCGYPASSIRERVYADPNAGYGILLYTASPDADGTLGGLVQQARSFEQHLRAALRLIALCSNDPVCGQHAPADSREERWLHGAACHGCVLIAETSCEMRNDYLDRALVVPTVGADGAAFFGSPW